ncbi:MAG: ABC transporter ATP-binding protein [Candidatus Marinimicrobia bacterium]|nr:ABC transporter ATP-binding protein [Candidatus Neomarinimicrobiota bacterium]MBT7376914.1 ABC transporter ATP-binding protein [Candidatus Neomarinimicrobiota bacterium]
MILASFYSVLNKIFDLAPEILIGITVDLIVERKDSFVASLGFESITSQIIFLGISTFFIWSLESLFQYLYSINWRNISQNVEHYIRLDAYDHVQKLDLSWYENENIGNITAILNDDVNQLERFLDSGINSIIQIIISTIVVGAVFFYISPLIACIAIMPIPIILIIAFFFQKNLNPRYQAVRNAAGNISTTVFNNLLGIQTIKSFIQEKTEKERLKKISQDYQNKNKHAIKLSSAFVPIVRMGVLSGFLGTMILGAFMALNGEIGVGSFSVLVFLTQRFLWPFTRLGEIVDQFERAMASTYRILNLINTPIKIKNISKPEKIDDYMSPIIFDNIGFSYDDEQIIFNNLNLNVNPGELIGIVGSTGAGKTTIAKLLLRFYDPKFGSIKIGNTDIKNISTSDLRKNIGFVSQEIFLIDGTIKENILYSHMGYDEKALKDAATKSQAHEFISKLPNGYDTLVGERGQKLSVGQKQRLAIARAIYKNPPILIFDEATSAVDNHTERLIQEAISEISKGRTTMVIAHRLSTIRHADRIIVIDNSKIIEDDKHDNLVEIDNGFYANLWKIQTGEGS